MNMQMLRNVFSSSRALLHAPMLSQTTKRDRARVFAAAMLIGVVAGGIVASPAAQSAQFGPFDYYDLGNTPPSALGYVEVEHFGPVTEQRRHSGDYCWYYGDLDYTLRAFPNHPGALQAVATYLETRQPCDTNTVGRTRSSRSSPVDIMSQIEGGDWRRVTAEGYFTRAISFRPNHMETHLLYARYLHRAKKYEEALKAMERAKSLAPDSETVNFELASLHFDMGKLTLGKSYLAKARLIRARAAPSAKSDPANKK
jgi:tetratricopeptide (TPR) repeat protein